MLVDVQRACVLCLPTDAAVLGVVFIFNDDRAGSDVAGGRVAVGFFGFDQAVERVVGVLEYAVEG